MPEITTQTLDRLRYVRASSIKAGFAPTDPLGLIGGHAVLLRRKGRDDGVVEVIATTDDIDLDEEVVIPTGANLDYFRKNGSVFVDHDTRFASRVGVARKISPWPTGSGQRGWLVDITMDQTALASEVLAKTQSGGMGVSIGFRARDWGAPTPEEVQRFSKGGKIPRSIVRAWDWLELSFTPMPCNVSARVVSVPERVEAAPAKAVRQLVWQDGKAYSRMIPSV